jgi:hypothetical protein
MKIEEPKQKAPTPAPETKTVTAAPPAQKPRAANGLGPAEKPGVTTGDKWVRPSSVERDRLRTAQRHTEKTELEKAREAFAVADKADVDSRMLRASEVRELMAKVSTAPEAPAAPAPRISQTPEPPRPSPPKAVRPMEQAPPAAGLKPASMKPVESGTVPRPPSGMPPGLGPATRRSEPSKEESELEGSTGPMFKTAPEVLPRTPAVAASAAVPAQRPPSLPVSRETVVPRSKYSDDSRIREIESDIGHFNQQLHQLESELETTRSSLDNEVERYRAAAETKRTRTENLEDDLRRAKNEWSEADKDYRKTKSRRDKEVDDAQKRIEEQVKRIKNAEVVREKRIREIEKEKQV